MRLESKIARRRRAEGYRVYTLYKRKVDKVKPVNSDAKDDKVLGGRDNWYTRVWSKKRPIAERNRDVNNPYHKFIIPRTVEFKRGKRLTPEYVKALIVSYDLIPVERDILLRVLYNREAVLAWT